MFRLSLIVQELLRRRGRALTTGLCLRIALVVAVTSLSRGLDRSQHRVLEAVR